MRRAAPIALVLAMVVAGACAPNVKEAPNPKEPHAVMVRGRVIAAGATLMLEPCDGSPSGALSDNTGLLRELLAELGSGDPAATSMFAVLILLPQPVAAAARDAGMEVLTVVHAAPEGRGCDIDWPAFEVRATGNEPFWSVDAQGSTLLLRRPGEPDRLVQRRLTSSGEGWSRSIKKYGDFWVASDQPGTFRIELRAGACRDGMSGAYSAWKATAIVDGVTFHGCAVPGDMSGGPPSSSLLYEGGSR